MFLVMANMGTGSTGMYNVFKKGALMDDVSIRNNILRTLLYYSIFNYPLTLDEIYVFHQKARISKQKIKNTLRDMVSDKEGKIGELNGLYYLNPNKSHASERIIKEGMSKKSWEFAKLFSLVIKQFPFVRGIFVTGTLSKNN